MIKTIVTSKAYKVILLQSKDHGNHNRTRQFFGVDEKSIFKVWGHMYYFAKIKENQYIVDFTEIFGNMFLKYTQAKMILTHFPIPIE